MNGAESLVRTLVMNGDDVCFTHPGTSEMHFVPALDPVLTLDRPDLDRVALARSHRVEGSRATTLEQLASSLHTAFRRRGPYLVELTF